MTNQAHRDDVINFLAKKVIVKMLRFGEGEIATVESLWINEYTDILYAVYPNSKRNLQDLVAAVNDLKHRGIKLKINSTGIDPDGFFIDGDTYSVEPIEEQGDDTATTAATEPPNAPTDE